ECTGEAVYQPDESSLDDYYRKERQGLLEDEWKISESTTVDHERRYAAQRGDTDQYHGATEYHVLTCAVVLECILNAVHIRSFWFGEKAGKACNGATYDIQKPPLSRKPNLCG